MRSVYCTVNTDLLRFSLNYDLGKGTGFVNKRRYLKNVIYWLYTSLYILKYILDINVDLPLVTWMLLCTKHPKISRKLLLIYFSV